MGPQPTVAACPGMNGQLGVKSLQLLIELEPEGNSHPSAACSMQKKGSKIHKRGSIQNETLIYILDTIGGIVAAVLMQACFAEGVLLREHE